jgi:drug/metabolite transporter (DMT)-like permease
VGSSVALVATQPVWAALIARLRGEHVPRLGWIGIVVAVAGAAVLSGVDFTTISARALFGDGLAMVGGMLAAAYMTVGAEVRRSVSTTTYTAICYSAAAAGLLLTCLVARTPLAGFTGKQWLCLLGLTVGAQLLGHSVFNRVLRTTSATLVSVSILFEIVGSVLLAAWWFGETPPLAALPAAVLIAAGIVLVIRAGARRPVVAGVD